MNEKQTFLQKLLSGLTGKSTYVRPPDVVKTREQMTTEELSKFSPELRKMLDAMAYKESYGGKVRINKNDQDLAAVGSTDMNSYGLLHMGQAAADTFNNRPKGDLEFLDRNLQAKNLAGPESDDTQKLMQGYRIKKQMDKYGRDLYSATRNIQNYNEKNYATSTMDNYNQFLKNATTTSR